MRGSRDRPGDVVALLLRNEPAFVEALTCIRCLDAVRVLIPWHLAAGEVQRLLELVAPRLLIGHADLLSPLSGALARLPKMAVAVVDTHPELARVYGVVREGLRAVTPPWYRWQELVNAASGSLPIPPGAPQAISLTSGSTGQPKVIRWVGAQRWEQWYPERTALRPAIETSIVTAPLYQGAQYGVFSQAWRMRAHQVILPKFDAGAFLAAVERHRVNHAYMVPTMFTRLLRLPGRIRERYDLSSLNYVFHTGAPCPAEVKRAMIDWLGPVIWEAYGCSEASTVSVCSSEEWLRRPGSVGCPVRPVVILDDREVPCAAGQVGRICIHVAGMPPVACAGHTVPRCEINGAEVIASGDMGYMDEDGYLYVSGRADDLINTGRVKVYPAEIENVLLQHPRVLDCCVFAIPDEEFGQVIGAVVELSEIGAGIEAELRRFLHHRISEHKIPVRLWCQTHRLRADSSKLNRRQLAARLIGAGDEPCSPPEPVPGAATALATEQSPA